jgi:hypothetical protein
LNNAPNPVNQLRGRLGQLVATKAPPEKIAEVRAELAEAELEQRITKLLEQAPPLSPEKKARLAALLDGGS